MDLGQEYDDAIADDSIDDMDLGQEYDTDGTADGVDEMESAVIWVDGVAADDTEDEEVDKTDAQAMVFTECCTNNKKFLVQFQQAREALQDAVADVAAALEQQDGIPEQMRKLQIVETHSLHQLTTYSEMLKALSNEQLHQAGAHQLSQLIGQTLTHLLANVDELRMDSGIT